jgi:precorrin-6B methylase 1
LYGAKFRFGNDYISDFVLCSWTSIGLKITLVELEPPGERPFTKNGKYARRLNEAIGQINDWMAWILENRDYFSRSIATSLRRYSGADDHPALRRRQRSEFVDAKIIIGRRSHLSEADDKRRQAIFQSTNKTIEITNYDRLLDTHRRQVELNAVYDREIDAISLKQLSTSRFAEVRQRVATHDETDQDTLARLSLDDNGGVLRAVAGNRNSPQSALCNLLRGDDEMTKVVVLRNLSADGETLALQFRSRNAWLSKFVLEHPNCPEEILTEAADGQNADLVKPALLHHRCPKTVLVKLAGSKDPELRRACAQHSNLRDVAVLEALSGDAEVSVRTAVGRNPNLTIQLVETLSSDEHPQVRNSVKYENPASPEGVLIQGLAKDGDSAWLRATVAKHPNRVRADIFARLADDENYVVRLRAAGNRNVPEDVRRKLPQDSELEVRRAAQRNELNK